MDKMKTLLKRGGVAVAAGASTLAANVQASMLDAETLTTISGAGTDATTAGKAVIAVVVVLVAFSLVYAVLRKA